MVDISEKEPVLRIASAEGRIRLRKETIQRILRNEVEKGDVISVAKVAGIMAAKRTYELIPMCHPIPIENVEVDIQVKENEIIVNSTVKAHYRTGVEMEALTATATALLTIWDMVKKYEKDQNGQYPETAITEIKVVNKLKLKDG